MMIAKLGAICLLGIGLSAYIIGGYQLLVAMREI